MADFAEILNITKSTAVAFDEFKKINNERVDALLDRVEQLEAQRSAGGKATSAAPARPDAGTPPTEYVEVSGQRLPLLRKAAEIRHFYANRPDAADDVSPSDFLRAVAGSRSSDAALKALSVGTDSAGGYSVPALVMSRILDALVPASTVLNAGAGILPLEDGAKSYTQVVVSTLPTAAWRAEAGNVAESDPAFGGVVMTPRSLAFRFKVSRELLMDGVGLDDALARTIAASFARELDRTALIGSGTAPEPRGLANTSGVQAVSNGANGTSLGTIKWSNLLDGVKAILTAAGPMPTTAIMAPRTLTGFAALADSTGQPLRRPDLLSGVTFAASPQIPVTQTVGSSTDCSTLILGDFTRCLFAMRERLSILRLNELHAATGEVGFVAHARVDFAAVYPAAFAVVTGIRP